MSPFPPLIGEPSLAGQPEWLDPISVLFLLLGLFFILFGLASHLVRGKFFIPSSVVATLFGILLGPKGLGLLASPATDSGGWSDGSENEEAREFLRWGARLILGIQVLAAGILLPTRYLAHRKNLVTLGTLLFPVMVTSSLISGLFAYLLIPGIGWYESLVIGACLGPTDPVLAGSVIKGHFADRHVEKSMRDVLLCESGANDGLGTPILLLALSLLVSTSSDPPPSAPTTSLQLLANFLTSILLYNTVLSLVAGALIGFAVRLLLIQSRRRGWIDEDSMLVFSLATSFAIIGSMTLLDTNAFLACFVAGVVMSWDDEVENVLHTKVRGSFQFDALIDICIFTVLGSVFPFDQWLSSSSPISFGRLVSLATLVLLFRRLPGVLLFSKGLPAVKTWGKTVFLGWFGPMGVGALYYALEADVSSSSLATEIFQVVSFVIFASIFVHGLTIRESPFFLCHCLFF
ncbi:Cation/H+ exchanger [Mrakia frigida]|uniref:Cation/H+ exchanger n=1 Tax=Mrakia frigida TaxID=29902 RepID=UPI003FCBFD0C